MAKIEIHQNYFTITDPDEKLLSVIYGVAADYTVRKEVYDWKTKTSRWVPDKTYVFFTKDGRHYRFHANQWRHFKRMFDDRFIIYEDYEITEVPEYETSTIELKMLPHWKLREDQEEGKQFCLAKPPGQRRPLLEMPTGSGKTVTASSIASTISGRLLVLTLARFSDKWKQDVMEIYDIKEKDICMVSGGKGLLNASHWHSNDLVKYPFPKIYILSIETFMVWTRKFTEAIDNPELEEYGCSIQDVFRLLDIRTALIDEAHMSLHQVFQCYCFLDMPWVLNCSATMVTRNRVLKRVQDMLFPADMRYDKVEMKKYIEAYACSYQIRGFGRAKIVTKEHGSKNYSHAAFERSILKNSILKRQYIGMLLAMLDEYFIKTYQKGDKCAIFVARKEMAEAVCQAIRMKYRHFDTRTYLENDPFENALDPDIRVSTVLSLGTGVDIKMLTVAIQSVSIDSLVSNIQTLGRLREQKTRSTRFYYTYCLEIPKQVEYHQNKYDILLPRTKSIGNIQLPPLDATGETLNVRYKT